MLPSALRPLRARPSRAGRSQRLSPMAVMTSDGRNEKNSASRAGTPPRSSRMSFTELSTPERKLPVLDTPSAMPVWTEPLMSPMMSHSGPPMMVMPPEPEPLPPGSVPEPEPGLSGSPEPPVPDAPAPSAMSTPATPTDVSMDGDHV